MSSNGFAFAKVQSWSLRFLLTAIVSIRTLQSQGLIQAYPFHHLTSSRPKCFRTESSRGVTIAIDYEAPDLIVLSEDDSELAALSKLQRDKNRMTQTHHGRSGGEMVTGRGQTILESYGKERYQMDYLDRRDSQFEKNFDISSMRITVENIDIDLHGRPKDGKELSGFHKTFEIKTRKGTLSYELSKYADVEICVQCLHASPFKPSFVSLRVREKNGENNDFVNDEEVNRLQGSKKYKEKRNINNEAKIHLSWLEKQLIDMIHQVAALDREFQHSKDHHHESFIQTSMRLNSSSSLYPKIQTFIIILVGAYQARIIIAYLKRMHIL